MRFMEWLSFVEDRRKFFDEGREGGLFPLVEAVDHLYRLAPEKAPFGPIGENNHYPGVFRRCFYVCHRAFLSSAMMTASGLPEDGEAITRRALEAAKTCLAIKANPANMDKWLSGESRVKRWHQRGLNQKPDHLHINLEVKGEPLYQELGAEIGALSDFAVHFTPEFFGRFEWEEKPLPGSGAEFHFGLIEGAIEMGFLMLCKHHELIVRVFDRCQDGKMLQQPAVRKAIYSVHDLHEHFRQLLAPTFDAMIAGENHEQ